MKKTLCNIYMLAALLLAVAPRYASAQTIKGNVYGGGEMAKVDGSTNVTIHDGQLGGDIFGGGEGTLNNDGTVSMSADVSGATYVTINGGEFAVRHMDTRDPSVRTDFAQHYNIYGGGNIASEVGETHVYVKKGMISKDSDGSGLGVHEDGTFLQNSNPVGIAQAYYQEGQMYFCIFGGGYGKNTSVTGNTWVDFHIGDGDGIIDIRETAIEDDLLEYQSYLDVIGGGFNGTVQGNTNVHVGGNAMCRNVYGGGLYATIGTQDDAEKGKTNVYITGGNVDNVYGGGVMGDIFTSTNVNIGLHSNLSFDGHDYAVANDKVTVLMSVYGGNDVSGKVPTTNIYHYGGTVDQNLFGAGNGDYTGYYTPGLCDYAEGDNDNYYPVDHSGDTGHDGITKGPKGNTYKGRPQTGNVNITIAGNSTTDKAMVLGQVFGGGNSCTMGAWRTDLSSKYDGDPHKWRDDPDYFLGGGNMNITIGSHIKIGRTHAELNAAADGYLYLNDDGENVSGLFMGCSGRHLATETNEEASNSYHHYYDRYTAKYWPGFAVFADNGTPLSRAEGLASFKAYLNNILIWSDNVNLNIANDVEDVWLSNFVGGGFRGSMKAHSATGQFHYSLPRGVTIGHAIVGGAYNTDVVYRVFDTEDDMHTYKEVDGHFVYRTTLKPEWTEGVDYHHVERDEEGNITAIVRFYYDGGILKSGDSDHRQQVILNAYNGGNSDLLEFAATAANEADRHALRYHKEKAILYLDLRCQLEPELIDGHVHGGNVFGGCFESGMVDGDLWTDYRCYIASKWYGNENFNGGEKMFANAADYQNNFAMMLFGAGYGKNTTVKGDTYTRALYNKESGTATYPCLYNIFGGSFQGTVDGNTNIYYNVGQQGLCVGGLYGGGSQGYLSGKTFVELAGGYIANVYGGACEANIGKGVHVWAYDGALRNWGDDLPEHDDAPLVIERVFGGSDVSGLIGFTADATDINDESKRIKTADAGRKAPYTAVGWPEVVFNNYDPENPEHVSILESYNPTSYNEETGALKFRKFDSYVQIGGDTRGDRGYPLVGQIYAGGNGEKTDTEHGHILPGINTALIELNDGNIMEAFGGGNKATVHEQNYIHTNGQHAPVSTITMPNALLSGILKNRVLKNVLDCYTLSGNTFTFKPNNVQRLFGGNNVAEMDIQPQWNLKAGHLGKVYAGGNLGNMTYYNPSGLAATAGQLNPTPKGLSIHVESDNITIDELYGGCRMADVMAINYTDDGEGNITADTVSMGDDLYGATVNISGGVIHKVYGGNDVAGHVYNGSNVNITGAINGDVYGSGNGDYIYLYDATKDAPAEGQLVERLHESGYPYYAFRGANAKAAEEEKLRAINAIRPNVDKAYLNIAGRPDTMAYVTGAVYCGGNASTISGEQAYTKFDIGSNCVLNGVYMGSNGERLTVKENVDHLRELNGLNMNSAGTLREYMNAVAMDALPRDFSIADTIIDAYIGTFCLGGNRGSMTAANPLEITIPSSVTIYNKIVGGCNEAYINYNGNSYTGGFTTYNTDRSQPKIKLNIYAKFLPREIYVPEKGSDKYNTYKGQHFLYVPVENVDRDTKRLKSKYCNIYGGCYTRGYVYGDVEINVYSDMVGDFLKADSVPMLCNNTTGAKRTYSAEQKQQILDNNIKLNETSGRPVFSVFGGGYGSYTQVKGNTHIRLLNNNNRLDGSTAGTDKVKRPSVNAIYGGGEQGKMIGTSTIHIADGTVYSNVVGGALAGNIYGNTEILVGYPGYWEVQKTGEYKLKRSNFTPTELDYVDGSGKKAVKQSIFLTKGDRINAAVYQAINDYGDATQTAALKRVENKVQKNWADIQIDIKGGLYGGGYSRANVEDGETAMANTVLKFTSSYNLSESHPEYWSKTNTLTGDTIKKTGEYVYGGNATIWVQDEVNARNWKDDGKEHITITTETDSEAHTGKGGIFGDGHSSLVAAFRSAAVEGYGYAEHPANAPKLLNTFQRFDILQIRDCSMKMYGQIDVATGQNDPTLYAVSRISELMLNSNIEAEEHDLKETSNLNSRNVIDFYNPVHFLGSITSEVTFKPGSAGSRYHDTKGKLVSSRSYYDYKNDSIRQNYDYQAHGIHTDNGCKEAFGKRNAGTAKNMIRIDDPEGRGVHLKVVQENNYEVNAQGVREEQSFYGPLSGVFEFALTHVNARGGGYVYSNNLHQQTISESNAKYPGSDDSKESFLQTSGNVFFVPVHLADRNQDRYVYDDCHPIPFSDRGDGQLEKAHYWFVEGDGPTWCSYPQKPTTIIMDTIHIHTAEELAWVYDYIDHGYDSTKTIGRDQNDEFPGGFAGMTIVLDNDIDLAQLTILDQREVRMIWCPIADQKNTYFKGTFDGNGHKIDGMLLDVDFITTLNTYGLNQNYATGYDHYFGLFAKTQNATIKNVELTAALVRNAGGNDNEMVHIGTLITQVDGTEVVDCSVETTDSILSGKTNELQAAAAFICHTSGAVSTIHRNFVTGSIEANEPQITAPISGFISRLDNGSKMEHCYSLVDVHAQQVAGLADTVQGGAQLEHSYYAGTLTRTNSETPWGAILANAGAEATVKHCYYDITKNPVAKGYQGSDATVFSSMSPDVEHVYSSWSTYGLPTSEMTSATSGDVWRSCYSHEGHHAENEAEEYRCQMDADDGELVAQESAWNKGVWTFYPGFYPFLKSQELDCSALTTAFAMPTAASFDMTTHTDLVDEHVQERWLFIDKNFQLPVYGKMTWSVANNTLLLDSVSNKAQNKVNAHLYLGGPDVLSINCDDIHRQMQDIYVTREDINSPVDIEWYNALSSKARVSLGTQLYTDSLRLGMLRNKEVTNISKKNNEGVYPLNGFDGDLHVWNREGDAGTVTNSRRYKVNGTITYYTGYTNPYLWQEVNVPYEVANTKVYRTKSGSEYLVGARTSNLTETEDGGNFWLRSFDEYDEILYGGSTFQQAWHDPAVGDNYGHRPSVLRFPKTMKVEGTEYLAGDYWCYNQANTIDGQEYTNGGSELRFYSTTENTVYGTQDWDGHEDTRGADNNSSFRVYGNPTLGNIQLEGYYWTLETEKRDTAGVNDSNVKPEVNTRIAQWFSIQQDPVIPPFGIWLDGPDNFKDQALDEGSGAGAPIRLRLSPLHEPKVSEQYTDRQASFTASGRNGQLGVFSYIDQVIRVFDTTGRLMFTTPVRANTGFTVNLTEAMFLVSGSESPRQVKVLL